MKLKNFIIIGIIIIILFGAGVLYFTQSNNPPENIHLKCCKQCTYGAEHDPSGYDISFDNCAKYKEWNRFDAEGMATNEKILTSDCAEYFQNNEISVSQCWEIPEP